MKRTFLLIALSAWCSTACVANRAYREQQPVLYETLQTRQFDPTATDSESWPYRLAFIEFDDRGEMFDRAQLQSALQTIAAAKATAIERTKKKMAAPRPPGQEAPQPVEAVVVVFVHGWKNNASESNGNVWGFRQMLAGLSSQYGDAPVVGVYIGWRGAVVSAPILKEFTFFDRHQKSQNLPNAHMVEVLLKVMREAKGANYEDPTISVLIGHSFGGAVLESALTQPLVQMVINSGPSRKVVWPATLILFLNEAQEATRSFQLIETLRENTPEREACLPPGVKQTLAVPALLSISSAGDYATRAVFPAIQAVARPFNSLRTYRDKDTNEKKKNFLGLDRQTPMFFNTTAHMAAFQSHVMGRADDQEMLQAMVQCKPSIDLTIDQIRYVIVEKPGAKNRTPYWAMRMPSTIVPDHSTIFTAVFRKFLTTLIMQVTTP